MSGRKIVVRINFNNYTRTQECLTKEWIDNRISIFMNYTLKSLKSQTNQDFKVLVLYNPVTESLVRQAIDCYEVLPANVEFIIERQFVKKVIEYIEGSDELYLVSLESDDMYQRDFMQKMHDYTLKHVDNVIIICPYGYMYDSVHNRLVKFYFYAPSFCVFVYKVNEYLKGKNYPLKKGWISLLEYPHDVFKEPCYINHCHGANSGLSFEKASLWKPKKETDAWADHPDFVRAIFGPEITDQDEIKRILETFTEKSD